MNLRFVVVCIDEDLHTATVNHVPDPPVLERVTSVQTIDLKVGCLLGLAALGAAIVNDAKTAAILETGR